MNNYPELIDIGGGVWSAAIPGMPGNHKLVPADAIVIERGDLPDHVDSRENALSVIGFSGISQPSAEAAMIRARLLIEAAEYLAAHPPIDEAQVKAMAPFVHAALEASGGCRDGWDSVDVTRALIRHGVVKPEVSK